MKYEKLWQFQKEFCYPMQPYLNEVSIYCQNWGETVCAVRSEHSSKFSICYTVTHWNGLKIVSILVILKYFWILNVFVSGHFIMEVHISIKDSKWDNAFQCGYFMIQIISSFPQIVLKSNIALNSIAWIFKYEVLLVWVFFSGSVSLSCVQLKICQLSLPQLFAWFHVVLFQDEIDV